MKLAVELDPFSNFTNNMLGFFLVCADQYDEAIVQLKKTLELAPNDPHILTCLAYAYAGKGNYDEGIKTHIPSVEETHKGVGSRKGIFTKEEFTYKPDEDIFTCPRGEILTKRKYKPGKNTERERSKN